MISLFAEEFNGFSSRVAAVQISHSDLPTDLLPHDFAPLNSTQPIVGEVRFLTKFSLKCVSNYCDIFSRKHARILLSFLWKHICKRNTGIKRVLFFFNLFKRHVGRISTYCKRKWCFKIQNTVAFKMLGKII